MNEHSNWNTVNQFHMNMDSMNATASASAGLVTLDFKKRLHTCEHVIYVTGDSGDTFVMRRTGERIKFMYK